MNIILNCVKKVRDNTKNWQNIKLKLTKLKKIQMNIK